MCRYTPSRLPRGAHARGGSDDTHFQGSTGLSDNSRVITVRAPALPAQSNPGGRAWEGAPRRPPPKDSGEVVTQPAPAEPMPLSVPGPVDQEGLAADLRPLDE